MLSLLLLPALLHAETVIVLDNEGIEEPEPEAPDRSVPPAVVPPEALELPVPTRHEIRPGVVVEHLQVPGVRKVNVFMTFHHGSVALCGAPTPACSMLSQLWDVAGEDTDATALESEMDRLDGSISSWVAYYDAGFELSIPRDGLETGLERMAELLYRPAFPKADRKRTSKEMLDWYTIEAPNDMGTLSSLASLYANFPADSHRGTRPDPGAYKKVSTSDLRALHETLLTTAPVTVQVVGDIAWEDIEADLQPLLAGIGADAPRAERPAFTPLSSSHVVAVHMPGQEQASVSASMAAPLSYADDHIEMRAVNFGLGGAFNSRLNANLREEKGWTYGIYSRYNHTRSYGFWGTSVDVEAKNVAATATEIRAEIDRVAADGVTAEEIASSWLSTITSWNRRLETDTSAANFYQSLIRYDNSVDQLAARNAASKALTPEQSQAAAARWFAPEAPVLWVVVGDRSLIEAQVEQLGPPVTWLTAEQTVMGDFALPR